MLCWLWVGAGLSALLDSALGLPLRDGGLWRESALVVIGGDLLLVTLLWSLLRLVAPRFARRGRRQAGAARTGFSLGIGVAAAPALGFLLPSEPAGILAIPAALLLAWLFARPGWPGPWRAAASAAPWLAAAAPLALAVACFLPPAASEVAPASLPAAAGNAWDDPERPPDILLVSVDTLRADRVMALGEVLEHLSGLRRRGSWADYGLSSSNQTVPAHATLLSGLGALEHGVRHNNEFMGDEVPLLAEQLRAAGWATAGVISNGLLRGASGFGRGFAAYDDSIVAATGRKQAFGRMVRKNTWLGWLLPASVVTGEILPRLLPAPPAQEGSRGAGRRTTDSALRYLNELASRPAPYFLFLHYLDPHHPYRPPAETSGIFFKESDVPERYRAGVLSDSKMMFRLREDLAAGEEAARACAQALVPLYDEEIVFVDRMLGELLAAVEAGGRPTVVFFTSDHGEHFGEHGLVLHSCSLYEELVRVPFVLAGPGVPARQLEVVPHLEDVVPTLLALAGLPAAAGLGGRDLTRAGSSGDSHIERYQRWLSLREDGWKLIASYSGGEVEPLELYAIGDDPLEQRNLLAAEPGIAARLVARARAELASAKTFDRAGGAADPGVQAALLEELGYVDGDHD